MSYDIFISYSRKDSEEVASILKWLFDNGVSPEKVFFDQANIEGATEFPAVIADAIDGCKMLIFFVSKHSAQADWVDREVYRAIKINKTVYPIFLEEANLPKGLDFVLGSTQQLEFYKGNRDDNLQAILKCLASHDIPIEGKPVIQKEPRIKDIFEKIFKKRNKNMKIIMPIVIGVIVLSAGIGIYFFLSYTTVPSLVGQELSKAERILDASNLILGNKTPIYITADETKDRLISEQYEAEGSWVKKGTEIDVDYYDYRTEHPLDYLIQRETNINNYLNFSLSFESNDAIEGESKILGKYMLTITNLTDSYVTIDSSKFTLELWQPTEKLEESSASFEPIRLEPFDVNGSGNSVTKNLCNNIEKVDNQQAFLKYNGNGLQIFNSSAETAISLGEE